MGDKRQFTLRLQDEVFDKIKIIADTENRSIAMQIEFAVKKYIADYEKKNGIIKTDE